MNINQFLDSPELMGNTFEGPTWDTWRAVLAAAFAVPMDDERTELFKKVAGGRRPPEKRVRELWVVAGRRSAKTQTAAAISLYLATVGAQLDNLRSKLSPGERGAIVIVAVDRSQATLALNFIRGMVNASSTLSSMVVSRRKTSVEFSNGVDIQVATNSFRAIRGRTLIACLFDELAFFRSDESANPDFELYRAALPGLSTTAGVMLGFSSPYSKRGLLYAKHSKHFGQDGDILVVQGATADFNPGIDPRIIEDALRDDPEGASAEWLGEFRSDLEAFISREVVEALVRPQPLELPYDRKHRYFAFVDPAGGGQDEFSICIAHLEDEVAVVDLVRGLRGVPASIVLEFSDLLRAYGIAQIHGDKYAGSWPADEFRKHNIRYEFSEKTKSDLYKFTLPLLNSGRAELPNHPKLINQLVNLERRTSRGGRDSIDHPVGGHDDLANSAAGALAYVAKRKSSPFPYLSSVSNL